MAVKAIFGYQNYRHVIPFFWLIFCVEFNSEEKNTKKWSYKFSHTKYLGKLLQNGKIWPKIVVKKHVTFDFVDRFRWFFHQNIRAWRGWFDEKFRPLGAFFQKLRFFNGMSVIIKQRMSAVKQFFSKTLLLKISKGYLLYTFLI